MNDELVRRYKRTLAGHRERLAGFLVATWNGLGVYDDEGVSEFRRRTAAAVAGAKAAAVADAVGFISLTLGVRAVAVSPRMVDVAPKLDDPFHAAWHAVKMGRPWEEAFAVGQSTAEAVGFDFVQSTSRQASDLAAGDRDLRWRRVPAADECDWCQGEASKTFASAAAADYGHERCRCDAVPDV